MRRILIALILLCSNVLPALAEKRFALVMAVDGYKNVRPLGNAGATAAYEASLKSISGAIDLKPDEVLYTASREHALARIDGVRN